MSSDNLISHPTTTQRGIDGRVGGATRFKFPSAPVVYEPEGMDKKSFEREFEVSPKAMFHLMFGDKSAVFQTLYHERTARRTVPGNRRTFTILVKQMLTALLGFTDIQQGAWTQLVGGRMKREFKYQIEYHDILCRSQKLAPVAGAVLIRGI